MKRRFITDIKGETGFPEVRAEPLPVVVKVLHHGKAYKEVAASLPDIEPVKANTHKEQR